MNKRIRELAEQAGFFPELDYDHTGWHAAGHDPLFEKFAELIVKECTERLLNDVKLTDIRTSRCVASINEHFGVEE